MRRTTIDYSETAIISGIATAIYTALCCLKTAIQATPPAEVTQATAVLPISWGMSITMGKITPADYVKVKNHIMKKSTLSGKSLTAADVNKDGKITPADYVKIKEPYYGKEYNKGVI